MYKSADECKLCALHIFFPDDGEGVYVDEKQKLQTIKNFKLIADQIESVGATNLYIPLKKDRFLSFIEFAQKSVPQVQSMLAQLDITGKKNLIESLSHSYFLGNLSQKCISKSFASHHKSIRSFGG